MPRGKLSSAFRVWAGCLAALSMCAVCAPLGAQSRGVKSQSAPAESKQTGRYFALVIGIDHYATPIPQLRTAVKDARSIAEMLKAQYGFETVVLTDAEATRGRIFQQLTRLETELSENDNLLIYYAGHGFRIEEADKSYWLPSDADSMQSSNRISADDLTTELKIVKARHVLVVSDSCYSGGLSRDLNSLPKINPDEAFLRKTLSTRSRSLMASGRDEPVADGGPDGHSVFAWAVLQALADQPEGLFTASNLFYDRVQRAVAGSADQLPVYQPIRNSGDVGGDFVFRRVTASNAEIKARLAEAAAGYDRAFSLYGAKDYAHALPLFDQSCSGGNAQACAFLGYMYELGEGAPEDDSRALALYVTACDGGAADGCGLLGRRYTKGQGVPQDTAQAFSLYKKSCEGGSDVGCFNLGSSYEEGIGTAQNSFEAVSAFKKVCDKGSPNGCVALGLMYERGHGLSANPPEASRLYEGACSKGAGSGCRYLGLNYESGQGRPKSLPDAVKFQTKACSLGEADSCKDMQRLSALQTAAAKPEVVQPAAPAVQAASGGSAVSPSAAVAQPGQQNPQLAAKADDTASGSTVSCRVIRGKRDRVAANVKVYLVNKTMKPKFMRQQVTDSDGMFTFEDVPPGEGYTVEVRDSAGDVAASERKFAALPGSAHVCIPDLNIGW